MGHRHFKNRDPDIVATCGLCFGPIYHDEPNRKHCPQCLWTLANIAEVNKIPPHKQRPRAERPVKVHI